MKTKRLEIVGERSSSLITVGESFSNVGNYLPENNVYIITDQNVFDLYSHDFPDFPVIKIRAGEEFKDLDTVQNIFKELLESGADRYSFILAVGGGVVSDIAGFVASTYMRGIRFGFISTSLLSQVDASVGGKNGVNLGDVKNIIGVFNQPEFVLCDPTVLSTLPERELISGFAEVIKYSLIWDLELFVEIERNFNKLLKLDPEFIQKIVWTSINIKKEVVEQDELEGGLRRILNFGHTFGHALEAEYGYQELKHGEAVILGMKCALQYASLTNKISADDYGRGMSLLDRVPVDYDKSQIDLDKLLDRMYVDKKVADKNIRLVLVDKIGHCSIIKESNSSIVKKAFEILL